MVGEKNILNINKFFYILLICIMIIPASATTTADLIWTKAVGDTFNYPVAVDTTDNGTVVYVAMSNGSILSYNSNGDARWNYKTNGSIKKIVATANGSVAWINTRNESGVIVDNSSINRYTPDGLRNVTDIGISRDGEYYAIVEKSGARITITSVDTGTTIQNTSYGIANWTNIAYDPYSQWIVTSNQSDKNLYFWNLTIYTGWLNFNPTKSVPKNASQTNIDTFPNRTNISISNFNALTHITFTNSSANSTTLYQINQSVYQYYPINTGNYLYFTNYGNFTDGGNCVNSSYIQNGSLVMSFAPTCTKNMTVYYGNKSYTNENFTSTNSYTLYNTVGSYTFTIPAGVTSVGYTIVGGGGGGAGSADPYYYGSGGVAGSVTTGTLTIPSGQTTISVVVGDGGSGGGSGGGSTGGSSTLNGTKVATGGNGGSTTYSASAWHAGGGGGSTAYSGISATIGNIGIYDSGGSCIASGAAAGPAGTGYGAGGGGGGASGGGSCTNSGGKGARGLINITYGIKSSPLGTVPTNSYMSAQQMQTTDNSLVYVTNRSLGGNVSVMDVPEMGGWVSVSTDEPKLYHQQMSVAGFGTQYSGTANTGTARMVKASDSAAYSAEARDLMADIYQLDGTRKGTYTTGGIVQSVDFAVRNGLWSIAGGDDGKIYVFSKDATSSWYVFYQGDSNSIITSVAISWRGEYFIVGRNDGNVEYYSTGGISTTTTAYLINVFVNKGGVAYSGANITITSGETADSAIEVYTSGKTDSVGKFSFTAEDLTYYKISINEGEYEQIYQATSTYTTVTINIPVAMITRPYDYASTYNTITDSITTTYTDVNIASVVNVTVIDMTLNQVVQESSYTSVTSVTNTCNVGVANKSHEFKVNVEFVRTTGHKYTDTIYVRSSSFLQPTTAPTTQWLLFKYAIYSVMLMLVALGIGAASTKWGVVLLPALAVLGVMIGFLPFNIYSGGILVSAFIAMLEVMRRRQD